MALQQDEQDRIWNHFQSCDRAAFDLSYPRLRYFGERSRPGTRVLNIGVGTGYLEDLLIQRGVEVHSLDPSSETIARLRSELQMGERAQQGYGQQIPFASESFDQVIMTEVLEHLPAGVLEATVAEVHRVLKPGGEFTGTVPFREDLTSNEVLCPRCQTRFHRWGHEQRFDRESLTRLLTTQAFAVERMYPTAFPDFRRPHPKLFLKALFRYALGRLGEPLVAPNLFFRARRVGTAL